MTTSNLQIMRALIAKDGQAFRLPLITLFISMGCYLIAIVALNFHTRVSYRIDLTLFYVSIYAAGATALFAAVFGGMAISMERRDRTDDFISLLPVTRLNIVLSKCLISGASMSVCAAFHAIVFLTIVFPQAIHEQTYELQHDAAVWAAYSALWICCVISLFGVAWLVGAITASPSINACASIATTVCLVTAGTFVLEGTPEIKAEWEVPLILTIPTLASGAISLVAGTKYYLRRIAM